VGASGQFLIKEKKIFNSNTPFEKNIYKEELKEMFCGSAFKP
jgi:hypothetical protein|tara:strand:+ start:883 stop:1008 length:126 start_codon:yes stop_codon:yes gene_type:complete